jgi:hypothetical protein
VNATSPVFESIIHEVPLYVRELEGSEILSMRARQVVAAVRENIVREFEKLPERLEAEKRRLQAIEDEEAGRVTAESLDTDFVSELWKAANRRHKEDRERAETHSADREGQEI